MHLIHLSTPKVSKQLSPCEQKQ